jgi:hypothetical protein
VGSIFGPLAELGRTSCGAGVAGWLNATVPAEAQAAGRAAAKKDGVEHLIHKKDGTIGDRNSYGNDPHPPKG